MKIQEKIANYITDMGIRQASIVSKTGISANRVSAIVNCKTKMSVDEYELFCRALKKDPGDFITLED